MTTWNYRLLKHDEPTEKEVWYGLHEVYFEEDGEITTWTENPTIVGDSVEDVVREVRFILKDLMRFPEAISLSELLRQREK